MGHGKILDVNLSLDVNSHELHTCTQMLHTILIPSITLKFLECVRES
jgi:hypothetical protein